MDRSTPIKCVAVAQVVLGVCYFGVGSTLLSNVLWPPKGVWGAYAMAAAPGLPFTLSLVGIGLVTLLGAYGIWRGWRWAWWLSLMADFGATAPVVYSIYDDHARHFDIYWTGYIAVITAPIVLIVLLLCPWVRRSFSGS